MQEMEPGAGFVRARKHSATAPHPQPHGLDLFLASQELQAFLVDSCSFLAEHLPLVILLLRVVKHAQLLKLTNAQSSSVDLCMRSANIDGRLSRSHASGPM